MNKKLCDALDEARYVKTTEFLIYVWKGGHTINIYSHTGAPIKCMNVGDFKKDNATLEEVKEGMQEHIESYTA